MLVFSDESSTTAIANKKDYDVYDPRSVLGGEYELPAQFTLETLDMFCSYVIDIDNDNIPYTSIENAKVLFEILKRSPYEYNDSLMARLEFIDRVLEARVDLNLDSRSLILEHVQSHSNKDLKDIIEDEILRGAAKIKLKPDIANYMNQLVYEYLTDGYAIAYNKMLIDLFDKKSAGKFKSLKEYTKEFNKILEMINKANRDSERFKLEAKGFDLNRSTIIKKAKKIFRTLNKPTNKLKLGIQYLNKMLNGGLEAGRAYLFLAITGGGKSLTLLSIADWIRKYNKPTSSNGMKQGVLFISQENSTTETFERLFNMNIDTTDFTNMTEDEFVNKMINSSLVIDDDSDEINLYFKEYSDKEIGVADIDKLIEKYSKNGVEIIAVIQDYIEKLNCSVRYSELRHVLGQNATDLSQLAKKWGIPVVSAAQLNRSASSVVDNAIVNNKKNTTRLLGKQFISEAWSMINNIDAAIILNKEVDDIDDVEKTYMGFKLEKFRGKPNEDRIYVFLHPFEEGNGILLTPDIDTKPLSKLRIEDFNPMKHPSPSNTKVFTDNQSTFMSDDLINIISDDYTDTSQRYLDLLNASDKESKKMKENQLKVNEYGRVIIEPRYPKKNSLISENGRYIIESRYPHKSE